MTREFFTLSKIIKRIFCVEFQLIFVKYLEQKKLISFKEFSLELKELIINTKLISKQNNLIKNNMKLF